MADVHGLGDVGRGKVDDHGLTLAHGGSAELRVAKQRLGVAGVGLGQDAEIDEAGTGDLGGGQSLEVERIDDVLGELARIGLALLGQPHGGVALVIAKTQVGSRSDRGLACFTENLFECGGEPAFEFLEQGHDGRAGGGGRMCLVVSRDGLQLRISRISFFDLARPSTRRTSQLVKSLAMADRVKRCSW